MAYLLIVDDDREFASSVATVCQAAGHEVVTLHTTKDAFASVAQRRPDGILLDVMFPEDASGGFQLARDLRRRFGDLPILLLTAVNQQFPLGFSSKDLDPDWLPVTDFVEKPVEFPLLLEKVNWLLSRKDATSRAE
jgi:DNA-binding response OmpR family regulator